MSDTLLQQTIQDFKSELDKITAFGSALALVHYDFLTGAPKGGTGSRVKKIGIMSEELFKIQTSEKMGEYLKILDEHKGELDDITYRMYYEVNKEYQKTKRIPPEFYRAMSEDQSLSQQHWEEAKSKNDFSIFAPWLSKMIGYGKKIAEYIAPDKKPYDALLDEYEPGMTTDVLDIYFAKLRERIVPLLKKVMESPKKIETDFTRRTIPVETQKKLADLLMDKIGYDLNRGQLRESEHPFSIAFGKNDCRITTHYHENDFLSSVFSVIHECGHAMYEQNKMDEIADTVLDDGVSNGIHESQSRFYENIIGRSKAFWDNIYDEFMAILGGDFTDVTKEMMYLAVNSSKPSLIRIEADELTYSLHIMIRYELEKLIMGGDVEINELPSLWNAKVKEYLDIDVPDDRNGILQDVHWSQGSFGYFPSYSLGSAYGAQFYHFMKKDLDVDSLVANGNIKDVTAWLIERVQKYGKMRRPEELLINATGEKFNADYYIQYLEEKFSRIYEF